MSQIPQQLLELLAAAARAAENPLPTRAVLDEYLAWQRGRKTPHSFATDRGYLEAFFRDTSFEDLREVTPAAISSYLVTRAAAGRCPKTLNRTREVLHTLFAWLIENERIARNPVAKVRRAAEPAPIIRYLTLPEVDELLEIVDQDVHLRELVAVVVFAGLRRGEATWLRREDLDLERQLLVVQARAEWQPKTRRNRVVPISSRLLPYLEPLADRRGWLLPSPTGKRWQPSNLTHRFRRVLAAKGRTWTLLELRHTFGTQLVMRGVSLAKVSAFMGNSPEICRRHYAHVATELLHQDVEFGVTPQR